MNLLHIDSSILADGSVSRSLLAAIVAAQIAQHPGDPGQLPRPRRPAGWPPRRARLAAGQGVVPRRSRPSAADIVDGAALLDAFLAADIVVVGAPMYNFRSPPS